MLLVILFISIVLMIIATCIYKIYDGSKSEGFAWISYILFGFSFFFTLAVCLICFCLGDIPSEIEKIEERNVIIEDDINNILQKYCEFQNKDFIKLESDEIKYIFVYYPELENNEVLNSSLKEYISNHGKINNLRINYETLDSYKWWLYFGGNK